MRSTKDTVELTREEAIFIKLQAVKIYESIENEYKERKDEYDADEKAMQVLKDRADCLEKIYLKIEKVLAK